MVGRDIGSVVLPDADLKFYLKATLKERVRRRHREMLAKDSQATYQQALDSVLNRDQADSAREHAPLVRARDAVVIHTTRLTVAETLAELLRRVDGWDPA
jgi:cytidylate kinase